MPLSPLSKALRDALARACPDTTAEPRGYMRVQAAADDSIDLLIYGNIGARWWDDESVTAMKVLEQLKEFSGTTINVRINSYGGSVSDGVAIHNELRRQAKAGVTVNGFNDGVACSIASLILVACDNVTMPSNTLMMLHAPWGGLYIEGNAKLVREVSEEFAGVLDIFGKAMAQSYARKSGRKAEEFIALWDTGKDYWYTAEEAQAEGLCDVVLDASESDEEPAEEDADATAALLQALIASAPETLRAGVRAAVARPLAARAVHAPAPSHSPASAGAHQAAPSAANTNEETTMPNSNKPADTPSAAPTEQQLQANYLAKLQTRNADIMAVAQGHMDNPEVKAYVDKVVADLDPNIDANAVGKHILTLLAKDREPMNGGGGRATGGDNRAAARRGMAQALAARVGLEQVEAGNQYNGLTLHELARAGLQVVGVDTRGMSRMDIVGTAFTHTSSDFPNLLSNTAHRAVLLGFEEVLEDISRITRAINLTDFKSTDLAGLGSFSDLDQVPEGHEYKYGTFTEQGQSLKLATYGKLFSISRQAVINDDLSLLSDVPRKMGQAAKRTIVKKVFALLTSNPVLKDGIALFHADHGNLLTGAAISTPSVDAMRVALAGQKDAEGNPIGYALATLLTPLSLGGLARTVRTSQTEVSGNKNLTTPNYVQNTFDVMDSGRLTGTGWYGFANPNVQDGLVVGYLDGQTTPYLEQQQGFTVDGVAWKVRIDAAAGVADYRALAYNPGA